MNRVLTNDPGLGVARHVDAGYEEAEDTARKKGVKIPMLEDRRSLNLSTAVGIAGYEALRQIRG